MTRNAFYQLPAMCQVQPFLDRDILATVDDALVTSRLDYCILCGAPLMVGPRKQQASAEGGSMTSSYFCFLTVLHIMLLGHI